MSRDCRHRLALAALLIVGGGCDDISTPPARITDVAFARTVVSLTAPGDHRAAEIFDLRVTADPGADPSVRWSSSDTTIAAIDASGVLHLCGLSPEVIITARSVADSTKSASARIGVAAIAVGWVNIATIRDEATGTALDGSALAGVVSLDLTVSDDWLDCTGLSRLEVVAIPLTGSRAALPVANLSFIPARRSLLRQSVTWDTAKVPAGDYRLEARAHFSGRVTPASTSTRVVTVHH